MQLFIVALYKPYYSAGKSHPIRPAHKLSITHHPVPQQTVQFKSTGDSRDLDDSLESDNTHDSPSHMEIKVRIYW